MIPKNIVSEPIYYVKVVEVPGSNESNISANLNKTSTWNSKK